MEYEILDVLEPYEEECLYSWITRMLYMYGDGCYLDYYSTQTMKYLFGPNTFYIGQNFQSGLDYFVNHCHMSSSSVFSSVNSILEKMTILPFYLAFKRKEEIPEIYKILFRENIYRSVEKKVGLDARKPYVEGNRHIKVCPKCVEEDGYIYFKREHQISGNFICEIHGTGLKYFDYSQQWSSVNKLYDLSHGRDFSLSENEIEVGKEISHMIHCIMKNGLQCDIDSLKEKIRSKLRSMGYLDHNYVFYNYSSFLETFSYDIYFRYVLKSPTLFEVIYDVKRAVNPIYYLIMIHFLFGNLENLYNYEIEFPHGRVSKRFSDIEKETEKNFSYEYYFQTMKPSYHKEHYIVGKTYKSIVLWHKLCGGYFLSDSSKKKLRKCPWCYIYKKSSIKKKELFKDKTCKKEYINFLTTKEYGEKYNKKIQQIYLYCVSGRLNGAILVGKKTWLIPEDAPYPKDKRYKNKLKE